MSAGFVEGLFKVTGLILDSRYNLRMMRKALANFTDLTSIHPSMESNPTSDWVKVYPPAGSLNTIDWG